MITPTKVSLIILFLTVTALKQVIKTDSTKVVTEVAFEIPNRLNLPKRSKNALGATELVKQLSDLSVGNREKIIFQEIKSGNVPSFCRMLKATKITEISEGLSYELIFFAAADYLAIGSDNDYFYVPLTPSIAQHIANGLSCVLPTKKMVDAIYENATVKLRPQPIPPSEKMTTVPVFWQHSDSVKLQQKQRSYRRKGNQLIAGHKKDLIISNKIHDEKRTSDKVVIYGWHKAENSPIQPVYAGHGATYADYSHAVRLIAETATINGIPVKIQDILRDPVRSVLLSNEGIISKPVYPTTPEKI